MESKFPSFRTLPNSCALFPGPHPAAKISLYSSSWDHKQTLSFSCLFLFLPCQVPYFCVHTLSISRPSLHTFTAGDYVGQSSRCGDGKSVNAAFQRGGEEHFQEGGGESPDRILYHVQCWHFRMCKVNQWVSSGICLLALARSRRFEIKWRSRTTSQSFKKSVGIKRRNYSFLCVCVFIHVCMYVWKPETNFRCSSGGHTWYLGQVLWLACSFHIGVG